MKKLIAIVFALFLSSPAMAGVSCSLPYNLQNGTTADATQVMANYNALLNCFSNAAASGVNNDITALSALSTPVTPTQGGTPVYVGGTSTGSANTQVVGSTTPSTFSLTSGYQVTFIAGFSNTGAMTLNVASTGVKNVYRRSQLGVSATVGGEVVANQPTTVIYDGTEFVVTSAPTAQVGQITDYAGPTAPAGWAIINGACVSRTGTGADLYSIIGTTYDPTGSTCDTAHFALPDSSGRATMGVDSGSRLSATCANASILGKTCGTNSTTTIAQTNLPNLTLNLSLSDTRAWAAFGANTTTGGTTNVATTASTAVGANYTVDVQPVGGGSLTGTVSTGGSGTAFSTINTYQVVNKIIKY